MTNKDLELVVVAPVDIFESGEYYFQGFIPKEDERYVQVFKNYNERWGLLRRYDADKNTKYKQLIPYIIVKRVIKGKTQIFVMKRKKTQGEKRLHNKYSIGVGGHMNQIEDAETFGDLVFRNALRELQEELDFVKINLPTPIGLINDDTNSVGRVHLGLLMIAEVRRDEFVTVKEKDKMTGQFMYLEELKDIYNDLESWSKIALEVLLKQESDADGKDK